MATPEQKATEQVRLAASASGARIFRNNSGAAKTDAGRMIYFGLGNDGSKVSKKLKFGDYIGFKPVVITPEMVGQTLAVFVNLEVKPDGHLDKTLRASCIEGSREFHQRKTCEMVSKSGGYAGFVCNEDDVRNVLNVK